MLITNYASQAFPRFLPTIQRLSFVLTAGFFMILFQYSVFDNWKIDLAFLLPTSALSISLLFFDYSLAYFFDILILAPFLEEFFFRGYMIGIVLEAVTMEREPVVKITAGVTAIAVSLCAFVVMHPQNEASTAFYYGLIFSVLMVAYRLLRDYDVSEYAVVFPIIPHFFNNFILYNKFNSVIGEAVTVTVVLFLMAIWSILAYKSFKRRLFW
ncbi:MAG: CPBP family glutamic-type intramembrane protease [Candidatus Methanomethylicaceae archaeon]